MTQGNPILYALMRDSRAEIHIATYTRRFGPCAASRVGEAFALAVEKKIIRQVATNKIGGAIYTRTQECTDMMN